MKFMFKTSAVLAVMLVVPALPVNAELTTDNERMSYAFGVNLANQVQGQLQSVLPDMDGKSFSDGIRDALTGGEMQLSDEEIQAMLALAQQKVQQRVLEAAGEAKQIGDAFRQEYAAGEGVVATDSGILYTVTATGDVAGSTPEEGDTVVVHYRGTLTDGTEFDSSYRRETPAEFSLAGIIPGWQEVLQLMRPGDKWEVVLPPELAYGPRGAGETIGPNETLVFEIELLEVK